MTPFNMPGLMLQANDTNQYAGLMLQANDTNQYARADDYPLFGLTLLPLVTLLF